VGTVEKARTATNRKRDESIPSTKPGHRLAAARDRDPRQDRDHKVSDTDGAKEKRREAATLPPPATPRSSGIRAKRKSIASPSATVDEVIADLSKDPRREDD
jgi:hypothetical protein